jgi:hypothetical protein
MSQRLLAANQKLIGAALDPLEKARHSQDRVVLLARLGKVKQAREILEQAQRELPHTAPPALQLRFEYVDAIRVYFSKHFVTARTSMLAIVERARHEAGDLALVGESIALALFCSAKATSRGRAYAGQCSPNAAATLESRYRAFLALGSASGCLRLRRGGRLP